MIVHRRGVIVPFSIIWEKDMWSCVVGGVGGNDAPGARHKHAVCACYPYVYLLGGRQGNLPLKDFWLYDLGTRTWRQQCEDKGPRPPPLQQHSMVASQGKIFVFGGELCMSNETPLWIYEIQRRQWRKWSRPLSDGGGGGDIRKRGSPVVGPTGRRGHTAVVVEDHMVIYGGYQDLRGSTSEMWEFNIKDESWRQVCPRGEQPPARHAHSAVIHDNQIWIYGGMTDLVERGDFWRYDIALKSWSLIRTRPSPGLLHSHVAVKLRSSMVIFGGERQGEILNDLWSYHFATGSWEKLMPSGVKPQPRTQSCAFIAPSLATKHFRFSSGYSSLGGASSSSGSSSSASSGYGSGYSGGRGGDYYGVRRLNLGHSGRGRGDIHKDPREDCSCSDCADDDDPDSDDDIDPSRLRSLIQRNCSNPHSANAKLSISKISQLNLSHLGKYYNYSMLDNDSSESIVDESLASTCDSTISSKLVRSQSIHGIKEKNIINDYECRTGLPRDIVSVPNFGDLSDSIDNANKMSDIKNIKLIKVLPAETSETCLEDDVTDLLLGVNGKLAFKPDDTFASTDTNISDNLMSFSCTESSLSSVGNYNFAPKSSFSNPNYLGYDPDKEGGLLSQDYWRVGALDLESVRHKEFAELLRTPPDSGIGLGVEMERRTPLDYSIAALEEFVNPDIKPNYLEKPTITALPGNPNINSRVEFVSHGIKDHKQGEKTTYPHSASRVTFCTDLPQTGSSSSQVPVQRTVQSGPPKPKRINPFMKKEPPPEPEGPDAMYVLGGKEVGQMTVFKRPISLWKLDLPYQNFLQK